MKKMTQADIDQAVLVEARYQFGEMQKTGRPFRDKELPLIEFEELQQQFPEIAKAFLDEARVSVQMEAMSSI